MSDIPTDTSELPAIAGSLPFSHSVDTAPAHWWLDVLRIVLATGNDTGGRCPLAEEWPPKGAGAPPHKHAWSDEHCYVLGGEFAFLIGDAVRTARRGDLVTVPRSTRHAFRVDSETAEFLNGHTPASLEAAVVELTLPAPEREISPEGATPPPRLTPAQMRRYGVDNVPGPNPLAPDAATGTRHLTAAQLSACTTCDFHRYALHRRTPACSIKTTLTSSPTSRTQPSA